MDAARNASFIVIPARLDRLGAVRGFVREALGPAMASDAASDLVLAVDEIVTNVIEHGYEGRDGTVEIEIALTADAVTVHVRDAGPPFDPTGVPSPDTTAPLAS